MKRNEWIDPKIIIGNKATGDYYYPRTDITDQILLEIRKGNHLLIAAPRRVGKTSIVVDIAESKCPKGMKCIFEDIQGVSSESNFYKRFYELILSSLRLDKKIQSKISNFLQGISIDEISADGKIKFNEKKQFNYLNEIEKISIQLKDEHIRVILFIDELPEVLHNLHKEKKINEAKGILKSLREWRQNNQYSAITLVLTGSIGIEHVVKKIEGRITDINDLNKIQFEPFTEPQAKKYITHVTKNATIKYNAKLSQHLINKISYRIPYFINLLLDEINKSGRKNDIKEIENKHIDLAFDMVIKKNNYFKDWKDRLFEYFPKDEALFMNEVLLFIAHRDKINKRELYNLARKHKKDNEYIDIIDKLEGDGYLIEQNNNYIYVSPFLKEFWKRNQPIYDGE